jgi:protoporphyrinogen oxidase
MHIAIIGAGPAGLTAAYQLGKSGVPVTVFERDPVYVGGISRTETYKGFHFDIGGHRFFSKSKQVEDFWTEILGDDLLVRPRSSRIYYGGKFFAYPLRGVEALVKLGPLEAARCLASYVKASALPVRDPTNFEDWVSNQFGRRLFEIFFKTYTEKVWGMPCKEISADWAAQRIKGLSLSSAIANALLPRPGRKGGGVDGNGHVIKTLIDSFRYPRKGPGMMWEACAAKVKAQGGKISMGTSVTGCELDRASGRWTVHARDATGASSRVEADHVISSAPLKSLAAALSPALSPEARAAAAALRYRDFLTVMLILEDRQLFDDNWIYIHDPSVKVGRIQNFKSWSPEMVPDPKLCCYGLEYFCFEGDGLWNRSDAELIDLAKRELEQIGLCPAQQVLDGCVVRQPKAYPVYDGRYADNVEVLRAELRARFPNLHVAGRNGMHKYNNQDHSMMTAMLTVENILAGREVYDVWRVNEDAEYHEAGERGTQSSMSGLRDTPRAARAAP